MNKICIIGVGLIGGSFARGLKKVNQVKTIIGLGRDKNKLKTAQKLNIIDEYSTDFAVVADVDLILIATPVNSFAAILQSIKAHIKPHTIITDVGSTKVSIMQIAEAIFGQIPDNFVPAHPIAGKEKSGVEASTESLFEGKRVILTPTDNTAQAAIQQVRVLWQYVGAVVEMMDAQQHDDLLAMTSHLPHILAFALMDYLVANNPQACDYAAGGFKDFSRIASSDALMWRDICLHNDDKIIHHIKGYQQTLSQLIELIKHHKAEQLQSLFANAKQNRDNWLK